MLRNVIESYLDSIQRERELDGPILALLAGMGFADIHFTHGQSEFGKDFIAKSDNGEKLQWAFQSKAGNLGTSDWRGVREQIIEASTNSLAHPHFDGALGRRVVLITNGRLVGNAPIDAQETNRYLRDVLKAPEFVLWDRERLVDLIATHGPERVHAARGRGDAENYGRFFAIYGDALAGKISERQIEQYSQHWLDPNLSENDRLVLAVIESALLASVCSEQKLHYISVHAILASFRAVAMQLFKAHPQRPPNVMALAYATLAELNAKAQEAVSGISISEAAADKDAGIFAKTFGAGTFVTYPVNCSRAVELLGLLYFLAPADEKMVFSGKLAAIVSFEVATPHLISDWYCVSLITAVRVLAATDRIDLARKFCRAVAVWVEDRYESGGSGLASVDVSESEELRSLLGFSFERLKVARRGSSFIATALVDCACFLGDSELYDALLNDFEVCHITPTYYQPKDTLGQFLVEGDDVITFPNVGFVQPMPVFAEFAHGEHLNGEPRAYNLETTIGQGGFLALSLLLRDRYFPTTWVGKSD